MTTLTPLDSRKEYKLLVQSNLATWGLELLFNDLAFLPPF